MVPVLALEVGADDDRAQPAAQHTVPAIPHMRCEQRRRRPAAGRARAKVRDRVLADSKDDALSPQHRERDEGEREWMRA